MQKIGYIFNVDTVQTEQYTEWMKSFGCTVILTENTEQEISRPCWRRLLDLLDQGDEVIVAKFGNALRGISELSSFIDFCFRRNVRIISVGDKIDSNMILFPETNVDDVLKTVSSLPSDTAKLRREVSIVLHGSGESGLKYDTNRNTERQRMVINMYTAGMSISEILKETGLASQASIYHTLKRYNIPLRSRRKSGESRKSKNSRHNLVLSYFRSGKSIREISALVDYSEQTVTGILRRAGAIAPNRPVNRQQTVIRMYQEGSTIKEITLSTGYTRGNVYSILKKKGLFVSTQNNSSDKTDDRQ